jgi:hypothetical protein
VFAKILAGLLRKTGEGAGDPNLPDLGLKTAEFPDSEDPAAHVPGPGGKKTAGALRPGRKNPVQDGVKRLTRAAGDISDPEGWKDLSGGDLRQTMEPEPANGAGIPARLERPSPEGTDLPAEAGREEAPPDLDFGALLGVEWDEAAAETENPGGRRAGVYADSPEENFSAGQTPGGPGLAPGDLRRDGSGEKGRDESRSRLAEPRQKDKRRDRLNIEVRDFRTVNDTASGPPNVQSARPLETPLPGRGETEILVELRGNPGREPQTVDHSWESRAGRSVEDFLARELHQNLNGDIVRHASVALRDGGEGTIRLALRPESLGNVKIRLEMAENKVTGHIIVESEAALRAFEREVSSLEQAFRDSGFDAAELDMSLAREGGGEGGREDGGRSSLPEQLAALRYDAALERPEPAAGEARTGIFTRNGRIAVNMLV